MAVKRKALIAAYVGLALVVASIAYIRVTANDSSSEAQGPSNQTNALAARTGSVEGLQARIKALPRDYSAMAALGATYVAKAKTDSDPSYYPKAEAVLKRSLRVNKTENYQAFAGMAALEAGKHHFSQAKVWAMRGLEINPQSAALYGPLADAEIQTGNYEAGFDATQRMVDLAPGTSSLARASYAWELRGDMDKARRDMQRALDDATNPGDRAFAHHYLAEIALNTGDLNGALALSESGLTADPSYFPLFEIKARTEYALGRTNEALKDFATLAKTAPEPDHFIMYGELLESVGRKADAQKQYRLFKAAEKTYESFGVTPDVDSVLYYADHGDPKLAMEYAKKGIRTRPFIEMQDAYGWALHVNGKDTEALEYAQKSVALGTRKPRFYYHLGMIELALGDKEAARTHLQTAISIEPAFNPLAAPIARDALAQLEKT